MKEEDFGDFEEVKEENSKHENQEEEIKVSGRVRMPRGKESIGVILQRYGGNRMEIRTTDGKTRNCRVPGRYKRRLWLRPKDIVIIVPWEDDDSKGDIIYKYNKTEMFNLKKSGILDNLSDEF